MASINRVFLIGRVAAVPELRYTANGAAVANFRIAVDRKFSKNDETDFFTIVAWRRLAEICNEYLTKGKLIAIEGRLQSRTFETQDGQKRNTIEIVADEMQMLSSGGPGGSGERGGRDREPVGAAVSGGGYQDPGFPDDGLGMDDIPF